MTVEDRPCKQPAAGCQIADQCTVRTAAHPGCHNQHWCGAAVCTLRHAATSRMLGAQSLQLLLGLCSRQTRGDAVPAGWTTITVGCSARRCCPLLPSGCGTHHLLHGLAAADGGGELAGLVQTGAQQTRDLLDDRLRGQEGVVALGCGAQGGRGAGTRVRRQQDTVSQASHVGRHIGRHRPCADAKMNGGWMHAYGSGATAAG
jgi:hypothetical protein